MSDAVRAAIEARDVSVARGKIRAVQGVSLRAAYGSVLAIVGPNGAGKSSLVRALAGLLPCAGSIQIDGQELTRLGTRERARRIAWVPQQSLIQADLSVAELVAQGRFAHARKWNPFSSQPEPAVQKALELTDVVHLRDRSFSHLSGGEQRRVLIARALATEARILLLDEPTAGLDVAHVLRTHALLRELARTGHAVVCVLHDLCDVEQHADQVALLEGSRLVALGSPTDVLVEQNLARVYGVRRAAEARTSFHLLEPTP
jgi:iron complex transport system ATP-binding protein